MIVEVLDIINQEFESLGLNYAYMKRNGEGYPYYVGEYKEIPSATEEGLTEYDFTIRGYTRGSWLELEEAKEQIKLNIDNKRVVTNESVVAIFYEDGSPIPSADMGLKRMEIHLTVKEWRVI